MSRELPKLHLTTKELGLNILDIIHSIYIEDIRMYVRSKYIGDLASEENYARINCEIESVKQYLISEGYEIRD